MSQDFPLTVEQLLPLVEAMARTGTHYNNMRTFLTNRLPTKDGFPVSFQLPVFPTVVGGVTFEALDPLHRGEVPTSFFRAPADYEAEAYVDRSMIAQL